MVEETLACTIRIQFTVARDDPGVPGASDTPGHFWEHYPIEYLQCAIQSYFDDPELRSTLLKGADLSQVQVQPAPETDNVMLLHMSFRAHTLEDMDTLYHNSAEQRASEVRANWSSYLQQWSNEIALEEQTVLEIEQILMPQKQL